jgi:hypothetical protein
MPPGGSMGLSYVLQLLFSKKIQKTLNTDAKGDMTTDLEP